MKHQDVTRSLHKKAEWEREALRRFGLSWWTRGAVEYIPRPHGSRFERLRSLGWKRENWPRGGLYVYSADPDSVRAGSPQDDGHEVMLTLDTLPELVTNLARVDTSDPESVRRFLTRWGLLGVGVRSREQMDAQGFHVRTLPPGLPQADSAALTHRLLDQLKAVFKTESSKRWELMGDIRAELGGGSHSMYVTLEFMPGAPQLWRAQTQPITALLLATYLSSEFESCKECGRLFPPSSQAKQFCSGGCRVRNHRRQLKKAAPNKRRRKQ